jgi:hypothetical protein
MPNVLPADPAVVPVQKLLELTARLRASVEEDPFANRVLSLAYRYAEKVRQPRHDVSAWCRSAGFQRAEITHGTVGRFGELEPAMLAPALRRHAEGGKCAVVTLTA